jgi:hypothetical protein
MLVVMKISIVRGGGFDGLATVTSADIASLTPDDARRLCAKVEQTGLFDLPQPMSGPPRQPHPFTYALTAEDQGRTPPSGLARGMCLSRSAPWSGG